VRAWVATIPEPLKRRCDGKRVTKYGFRAGPSFVAGKDWRGAASLGHAVRDLVKFAYVLKGAHIHLEDGTRLFFGPFGFLRETTKDPT